MSIRFRSRDGAIALAILSLVSHVAVGQTMTATPTPPPSLFVTGTTTGCFGTGCTPQGTFVTQVGSVTLGFTGQEFRGETAGGVLGINVSSGTLGSVQAYGETDGTPQTVPFSLQIHFANLVASDVVISGTVSAQAALGGVSGAVTVDFGNKKASAGTLSRIDYIDRLTGAAGQLSLTVLPAVGPPGIAFALTGLITITK